MARTTDIRRGTCANGATTPWHPGGVRYREFWDLVDDVFGRAYGRSIAGDQVLEELGGRTAARSIEDGVEPRLVWHALCDAMQVPDAERWGSDPHRQAPPR